MFAGTNGRAAASFSPDTASCRMGWTALCVHENFRKDRRGEVIWAHDTKITGAHPSFRPAASAQTFQGILR